MKILWFLVLLTLALACPAPESSSPKPHPLTEQTVVFPENEGRFTFRQPAATGTWIPRRFEGVRSMVAHSGPFDFDSLVILPSSVFGIYRQDSLLQYGSVTYLNSRMKHQPAHFVGAIGYPDGFNRLGGNSSIETTDTTLSVSQGYRDGADWYFARLRE